MNTFDLKIYSINRSFYDGEATSLVLPTATGQIGVLARHENVVIGIVPGEIKYTTPSGDTTIAITSQGFAEVVDNKVAVLVNTVELPEEIDVNRATRAKEIAEEKMRQKRSMQEYYNAQSAVSRAMARLRAANRNSKY